MNTANQMAEEIYGLHCDIGRLENEKKHWHTEFINEHEYAHAMEERAENAEAENAKLLAQLADVTESMGRVEKRCAKLRELVADMFRDFANADYELKRHHGRTFMAATRYEPRMRELGVEVE